MNTFAVTPSPQTPENDLLNKTTAGYQAWFHASEDLDHGWGHWSHITAPEAGNVHPEMFPDFSDKDLEKAIVWFSSRTRRFGKTDEQVECLH